MDTGTIILTEVPAEVERMSAGKVALYCRVSSAENRSNLESQAEWLVSYCAAKGYQVCEIVKEVVRHQ
jgi:putative resolvase